MVRVTIDLVSANDGSVRNLGVAEIANDGTGTGDIGNYKIALSKFGGKGVWRKGTLQGFPRKALGGWDLLFRCLEAVVGYRNRKAPDEEM